MQNKNVVPFLEVLAKYCLRYLGEKDATTICSYFLNNHSHIIRAIKDVDYLDVDLYVKIDFIFSKIKTDVFESRIRIYHINIPYDDTNIEEIDFKTFCLDCYELYERLNKSQDNPKGLVVLGFESRILGLLLPPKGDLLFNPIVANNKFAAATERLYAKLKTREADIIQKYGRNFDQLIKKEFANYVEHELGNPPQQISYYLWHLVKKD